MKLLYLLVGGLLGTAARFYLSHAIQHPFHKQLYGFPLGTLAVNAAGCYLMGLFVAGADKWAWGAEPRVLAMAGFCGAFTTFSALVAETSGLWQGGAAVTALLNVGLSLLIGFFAFGAGVLSARAF